MVRTGASAGLFGAVLALAVGCGQGADVGVSWGNDGGWGDTGVGPAEDLEGCAGGVDVPFEGRPDDVLPLLSGLRSATGTMHATDPTSEEQVTVTLDLVLPPERSWWEWIERDGVCWSSLQLIPEVLSLNVGEGSLISGEQVTVVTPSGRPTLSARLDASAALIDGAPEERVVVDITRTEGSERGTITDAAGDVVVRW